jgi:uncharacterized membrane protein
MLRDRNADLALVGLVATLALIVALRGLATGVLGFLLGVPAALLLPGYAITAALVVARLGLVERAALSISVSVSAVVLGGLLLNVLPDGLQSTSWRALLWLITIAGALVAFRRRARTATTEGTAVGDALVAMRWQAWLAVARKLRARDLIMVAAALLVVLVATGLAIRSAAQHENQRFTQLWIQPSASGQSNQPLAAQIGITNDELTAQQYRLVVTVDGKSYQTYQISLRPDAEWQQTIRITLPAQASVASVDAALYRTAAPTKVYRHVHLDLSTTHRAATSNATP